MAVSAGRNDTFWIVCMWNSNGVFFVCRKSDEIFKRNRRTWNNVLCGDARYNDKIEIDICQCLHRFLENKKLEAEYARRMLELVDGKGVNGLSRFCVPNNEIKVW